MDVFTKEKRSEIMSKIRAKNTKAEGIVFRYLRSNGVYFQKHYKRVAGCPDIALPRKKIAVFIDGDFWHGRDFARRKDRLPDYWKMKIEMNMKRDRRNRRALVRAGWRIMRVWEKDLLKRQEFYCGEIMSFLERE
jgi:DNA mismatch endonuclease (patch repair protein)